MTSNTACATIAAAAGNPGVEIGAGFHAAELSGEENGDEMRMGNDGKPLFLSNNAGGILGGISTGQPVVARFAVKPTSSILIPRRTVDRYGHETEISTTGRHDPCVGIRAVPIGEAMVACVNANGGKATLTQLQEALQKLGHKRFLGYATRKLQVVVP